MNVVLSYTRCTHASVIFIVSVSIMHTSTSYPHVLAVVSWYPRRGGLLSNVTRSLTSKRLLHAGIKKITPPPRLYDMHHGLLA